LQISLHIAPVGLGPFCKLVIRVYKRMISWPKPHGPFVFGPSPIPALTCSNTPELSRVRSLCRSRHGPLPAGTIPSLSYGFTSGILGNCPKRRTADTSDRCIALPRSVGPPQRRIGTPHRAAPLQSCPSAPAGPWTRSAHVRNRNAQGRAGAAQHMDVRKAVSRRFCQSSSAFSHICPASVWRITVSGILSCGRPVQYAG
jgi:hypothetical protein